jgi:hypothetical protein
MKQKDKGEQKKAGHFIKEMVKALLMSHTLL